MTDQDFEIARLLYENPRPIFQDFAVGLVRECLTTDPPLATRQGFKYVLDELTQLVKNNKATEQYVTGNPSV